MPPVPHFCVAFGLHAPSFVHAPQPDHVPVFASHVRVCIPHMPQVCVMAPVQVCPVQAPHVQSLPQVWVPFAPQLCVAPGAHAP
jgi:hypothetical protein